MICISAQPHDLYFLWQVDVQAHNFRKFNLSDKMHVLVWFPDNELREQRGEKVEHIDMEAWLSLAKKYPEVKFSFYKDRGLTVKEFILYIPQLRPQILAKHFDANPELSKETIFYHDSDIIFNYLPDFELLSEGPTNWVSDTSSYLDYRYLRKKEEEGNMPEEAAVTVLANIGNITNHIFRMHEGNTGGAQYVLKNIDGDFWRDVERMCIEIRKAFTYGQPDSINTRAFKSEDAGFQSWCADMWAMNMALWSRDRPVETTPQLDFSWATDSAETYHSKPIMHNAGATGTQPGVFYKGAWIKTSPLPHAKSLTAKKDSASWFYLQAIKEAAQIT